MGANSEIQWTTHTLNPWRGCSKVHAGCLHCYAESNMSVKLHGIKWGPNGTRVRASDAMWKEPLKWNREAALTCLACGNQCISEPAAKGSVPVLQPWDFECNCGSNRCIVDRPRVFCASLADVFEDWQGDILDHDGKRLWVSRCIGSNDRPEYIRESPQGDFSQCRPARMDDLRRDLFAIIDQTPNLDWLLLTKRPENVRRMWGVKDDVRPIFPGAPGKLGEPLPCKVTGAHRSNVWIGTSVSDQATADEWGPRLNELASLCPVTFLSMEPLIGPVVIPPQCLWAGSGVKWVIVGGESGHNARPCHVEWVQSIVGQCAAAGVPCFVKQLGASAVHGGQLPFPTEHKKGGDISEWPEGLQIRQFPTIQAV